MQPDYIWHDVYIVGSSIISHPLDCCVYLIDAGGLILVDAGAGYSFSRLVDNIELIGLTPENLSLVVATHCHVDHIGSLAMFRERYKAKIVAHELDAEAIESGKDIGADFYGIKYQPCPVDIKLAKRSPSFGSRNMC